MLFLIDEWSHGEKLVRLQKLRRDVGIPAKPLHLKLHRTPQTRQLVPPDAHRVSCQNWSSKA